jgi:hypothetical protein
MTSRLNSTEKGMLARGVPSNIAKELTTAGHTLSALRSKSSSELVSLGIPEHVAGNILSGRPPIPPATLLKLLFNNKWTCCVCRDHSKPVVIHHIKPWATSRSHDADNLVVLCPIHHDAAHTKRELTQSLTQTKLRDTKRLWEEQVKQDDSIVIRKAAQTFGEYWQFFNLSRLHEIAEHQGIGLTSLKHYTEARQAGILDDDGSLVSERSESVYAYTGRYARLRYNFARDLFLRVLNCISIENVSDRFDRGDIGNTIIQNDFIYVEGAHTFCHLNNLTAGAGQEVQGTRSANSVRIVYTFDRWYATSSSAHSQWLSGRHVVGSFCRVGDISREDGDVVIKCTVLAICTELPEQRSRSYVSESLFPHIRSLNDSEDGWMDEELDESSDESGSF